MVTLSNSSLGKPSQKNSNYNYFSMKTQILKNVDVDDANSTGNTTNEFKKDGFDGDDTKLTGNTHSERRKEY